MPKEKISLNSIYISERLQKSLQPVSNSALTAITAPMGYGKTTAVNWYLSRLANDSLALLIRISILLPKLFPSSGKVCKMHFPSQVLTFWKTTIARKMKPPLDF